VAFSAAFLEAWKDEVEKEDIDAVGNKAHMYHLEWRGDSDG